MPLRFIFWHPLLRQTKQKLLKRSSGRKTENIIIQFGYLQPSCSNKPVKPWIRLRYVLLSLDVLRWCVFSGLELPRLLQVARGCQYVSLIKSAPRVVISNKLRVPCMHTIPFLVVTSPSKCIISKQFNIQGDNKMWWWSTFSALVFLGVFFYYTAKTSFISLGQYFLECVTSLHSFLVVATLLFGF